MEGGVGAFTRHLGLNLVELGHEVHILTHRQARPKRERVRSTSVGEAWQKLYDINEPIESEEGLIIHGRFTRWNRQDNSTMADIAIRFGLDVVNIQYQAAAYNMRRAAINILPWRLKWVVPTVVTYHDLKVPYLFPKAGSLRNRVVRRMGRQAAGVIVTNQADEKVLSAEIETPIANIPIGSNIAVYPTNHIEVEEIREKHAVTEQDYLIGYFGFLHPSKGADTLIQALTQLPSNFHLLFIGGQTGSSDAETTSHFQTELQQLIDQNGLSERVHWTGFVPDRRVSAYLSTVDVVALPYQDGVSLRRGSLMAALAHGRPIISTQTETEEAALRHGHNLLLVPPGDPDSLASEIKGLAVTPQQGAALGLAAKETAARFDWSSISAETLRFYRSLID